MHCGSHVETRSGIDNDTFYCVEFARFDARIPFDREAQAVTFCFCKDLRQRFAHSYHDLKLT
jgi:hypothetical protein